MPLSRTTSPATNPSQVLFSRSLPKPVPPPQNTHPSPTFYHLQAVFLVDQQLTVKKYRPSFPGPVCIPALRHTDVNPLVSAPNPVVRVKRNFIYIAGIGRAGRHVEKFLYRNDFYSPQDPPKIEIAVVVEKRTIGAVVVQPLLYYVVWPVDVSDLRIATELGETKLRLTGSTGQLRNVRKLHHQILAPQPRTWTRSRSFRRSSVGAPQR